MQTLSDYEVLNTLHEGSSYKVYEARDLLSKKVVILKATRSLFPSAKEVASLKREMELSRMVDAPGVIQTLNFRQYKSAYFLVQESIGGITLKAYLNKSKLDLKNFFKIAISLAKTLNQIHEKGIIHKGINPSNIIINPDTGEVKITDFSISTRLNQESTAYAPPNAIVGTLDYISPEQTGRVNRSVDYRSDLYSLGVTFFEMLSGHQPFSSKTPIEVLCKHITAVPPRLKFLDPKIPEVISQIVEKLMQKNAEDRYQSALGLMHDLEKCRNMLKQGCLEKGFKLGEEDYSNRLQIVEKLYGRKKEQEKLLSCFWKSHDQLRVVWITGPPGIGKTALVQEVHRPITQKKGIFITGKFEQYHGSMPYYALSQAFNNFFDYLLAEPEDILEDWKKKLITSLRGEGQALVDILPNLELLIGKQVKLPSVSASEGEQRLIQTFKRFLKALCTKEHPLTLFLDDMQWADLSTLNLLEKVLIEEKDLALLFISAYREKEVSAHHNLINLLESLNKAKIKEDRISLESLTIDDIIKMLSESLGCEETLVEGIAKLVYSKTYGNPFFIKQLLKILAEENLLKFSPEKKAWLWDLEEIQTKDFSGTVVELLIHKIERLSKSTQEILQLAAFLGNIFDLNNLAAISKTSLSECLNILWPAVREELVKPLGENYRFIEAVKAGSEEEKLDIGEKLISSAKQVRFQFVHDRVRDAAHETIEESKRKPFHLMIGRILESSPGRDKSLYEIVSHYQKSGELINKLEEKLKVAKVCLLATKKASSTSAFDDALSISKFGLQLLDQKHWSQNHDLMWGLFFEKASSEFSLVRFEECEKSLKNILLHSQKVQEKVLCYQLYLSLLFKLNRYEEGVKLSKEALSLLGLRLPKKILFFHTLYQFFMMRRWIKKDPDRLRHLPPAKDPKAIQLTGLILSAAPHFSQYFPEMNTYLTLWLGNYSIRHGNTPESCIFYTTFSVFLVLITKELKLADTVAKVALSICNRYPNPLAKGVTYGTVGNFIQHWKNPIQDYKKLMKISYNLCRQSGEMHFADYALFYTRFQSLFYNLTNLNDIIEENKECYKIFQEVGNKGLVLFQEYILNLLLEFLGSKKFIEKDGHSFDLKDYELTIKKPEANIGRAPFYVIRLIQEYIKGNKNKAFEYAQLSTKYSVLLVSSLGSFMQRFFYCLSYHDVKKNLNFWQRLQAFPKMFNNKRILKLYAKENPQNFSGAYFLVKAKSAEARGRNTSASQIFNQAIKAAEEQGFAFPIALAYQLAAEFYLGTQQAHLAGPLLKKARDILTKWGALGLVKDLESRFSVFLQKKKIEESYRENFLDSKVYAKAPDLDQKKHKWLDQTFSKVSHSLTPESLAHFDFQAALKSSYAILGEMNAQNLIKTLMKIVIENSGADRVCLILRKSEQFLVEAEQNLNEEIKLMSSVPIENYNRLPASIIQYVIRTKKTLVINELNNEQIFRDEYLKMDESPKSLMVLPIVYQEKLLSLLYLENKQVEEAFNKERQLFLNLIVAQIAISLNNVNLYNELKNLNTHLEEKVEERTEELNRLATMDPLTGVFNRRQFFKLAEEEYKQAQLLGSPLCSILLDVDNFKEINDKYGHGAGDEVLKNLSKKIFNQLNKKDILARVGGEEFAIVLPGVSLDRGKALAEAIRSAVEELTIREEGHKISVTVSIGISVLHGKDKGMDALLKRADLAMYQAKQRGRNRVEVK